MRSLSDLGPLLPSVYELQRLFMRKAMLHDFLAVRGDDLPLEVASPRFDLRSLLFRSYEGAGRNPV
jgi:hypothetical protein